MFIIKLKNQQTNTWMRQLFNNIEKKKKKWSTVN